MYKIIKNISLIIVLFNLTIPVNVLAGLSLNEYQSKFSNYIDDREYDQALKLINEAMAIYPQNAENYNLRGMAHTKLKEYESSITDLTSAIELLTSQNKADPNISSYYINRSQVYIDLNEVGAAVDDLKTAMKIYPNHGQLYYTLAIIYEEKLDDYEAALKNINTAIKLDPWQVSYYSLRGCIYDDLGKFDCAVAEFKEEITRVPKFYAGYYQLGCLYLKHGQNNKAQEYFNKAIDTDPKNYELYENIGAQYNLYEDNIKALEYFNKSLAIKPNDDAYCGKAIIFDNRLINYQAALDNINLAIKLNPNAAMYYQIQGYIYNNLGQTQKAIEAFGQEIKLSPNYCKGYVELGHIYLKAKKNELAKYYYDKAIDVEQGPKTYELYYQIGLSYCFNDDPGAGIKYMDKAIALKPTPQIYHARGVAKRAVRSHTDKNFTDAMVDFNQALKLDPDYTPAFEAIILTKFYNKDYKGVVSDIKQYFKNHKECENTNYDLLESYGRSLLEIYKTTDELEEGIKCFKKVAELKPDYCNNNYRLAEAYYYNNNSSRAYDLFKLDLQNNLSCINKDDVSIGFDYAALGNIITILGIQENALDYLNKAVNLIPHKELPYLYRAKYYITQLKFKEAIDDLNTAIKIDPDDNINFRLQVIIYFLAGQYGKSLQICHKIINSSEKWYRAQAIIYGYLNYKYLKQSYKANQFIKKYLNDPLVNDEDKTLFKYLCGALSRNALLVKIKASSSLDFGNTCVFNLYLKDGQKDDEALKAFLIHEYPENLNYLCTLALAKRHHLPVPCRYESLKPKSD